MPKPVELNVGRDNPIVVSREVYKGSEYIGIRFFYHDDNGELKPTPRGINIPVLHAEKVLKAAMKLV